MKIKPREKMIEKGARALSDAELLSILLGSGNKDQDVFSLAKTILKTIDAQKQGEVRLETLQKIRGIGLAKACTILAALEFSRRRIKPESIIIKNAVDIIPYIQHFDDRKQEHFLCISLNGANEVIKIRVVTIGLVNQSQVHPREVFAEPITERATAIIIAHNHPSGNLTPSKEDIHITRQLQDAGEILGIKVLDHIIFNKKDYYSFRENSKDLNY